MDCDEQGLCFCVLDVRSLWTGVNISDAAADALEFVSQDEQAKASKFYFIKDAKLSLASSLLKRLFVVKCLNITWTEVQFTRMGDPLHGKPCHYSQDGKVPLIDFNVSHQAGLVVFIGSRIGNVQVGVDVTCVDERNDRHSIAKEGIDGWVDMHADVFSEADLKMMKSPVIDLPSHEKLRLQIRRFYAYWALKEAYVKLEGEALLANWLKDVEFRNVSVPDPVIVSCSGTTKRFGNIEIWFRGTRRADVEMSLEAFEGNYLIAAAVKKPYGIDCEHLPALKMLDLKRDVMPFADKFTTLV